MAFHLVAAAAALVATGVVVWWKGGRADRAAFTALAVAFIISPLLQQRFAWTARQIPDFFVDVALLIALSTVAVRSKRVALATLASLEAIYVLLYVPFWISPVNYYRAFYYGGAVLGYLQEAVLIASAFVSACKPSEAPVASARRSQASA